MKTTCTTVFLSLAILASFLFVASAAFADIDDDHMPTGDLEVGSDGVTFNISGTKEYGGVISGTGPITKTGNGELILTGSSFDYTGSVNVNKGTLTLDGDATLKGSVSVNGESVFKCGVATPGIASLTVSGGYSTFAIGTTTDSYEIYLSDFTLSNGFIEFDINEYDPDAGIWELDKDHLYVGNGTFTSGAINLKFHGSNDNESIWLNAYPDGFPIISISEDLEFQEGNVVVYSEGQPSNNWTLVKDPSEKYIYLKPKSSQDDPDDPPQDDPWYYANSQTDLSRDVWEMNKNPKIGVKFPEGNLNTAEFGSADNLKSIVMTKNGDGSFTQGEYQIADGKTLTIYATISGDADLLKTGAGTLVLNGNNTYTGKTYVTEGTLTLATAGSLGTLKGGSEIIVDGSKGTAILSGQGDVFAWGANAPAKISLINGGILQNDGDTNHSTMGAVIEMNNGIIQTKNAEATGTSGVGSYIMDNAIHVIGGQNNAINLNEFSIRHLDGTRYAEGEDAGYFVIAEGAKLTINAKMDSYGGVTNLPIVKTGKGELELTKRNENIKSDFIIKEGKVIGSAPNNGSSTFGYGTLTIEKDAILECHVSNQFGYGGSVQENIVIRGTLVPSSYTHMHNVTLESGTIETEILTNGNDKSGLDFYNRTSTITSSGESVIKAQISKSGGTMTVNVTDGELTISGLNTSAVPFTKTGAGTLKLTNANTNTGGYDIQDGVVVAGNAVALGSGAITIGSSDNAVGQLTIGASSTEPLDLTVGGLVTVDGGQINFDFTADDFDTLIATNGFQFNTGTFNLNFAQGTEATWYENAPEEGYKIVSITNGYTGDADLSAFLSGRTQPWTLTATSDGIYLGQAEDPSSLYWNPIADNGKNWPIDGTEKIGVKYNDESNEGDAKTASHDDNITLESDGVFIIGDGYELDQVGPISGDGDLTKTEGGTLVLSGDNTYTGDTIVSDGTLKLNKDDAIASSGNVTNNATIESNGNQTLNNLSGTNPEAEINANGGTLLLNNAPDTNTRYDGTINGNAKVKKTGFGSLLLTGENSYTGGTEVDAGSLVLLTDETHDASLGVGPIEVAENGELVYDVAAGQTKQIENKITGAGTITKTGAGTLKANTLPPNDGTEAKTLQAGSFNVKQGEFDLLGEFEGDLNVGPLDDNGNEVGNEDAKAVFSPGNSVGDATVYGDVNINAKATGLFEFGAYTNDPTLRMFDTLTVVGDDATFTISDDAIIELKFLNNDAYAWAEKDAEYQLVKDPGFANDDYSHLLAGFDNLFQLLGKNGDGLYLVGLGAPENPGVPEPSTWALLLLGVAGLYWMRRRK